MLAVATWTTVLLTSTTGQGVSSCPAPADGQPIGEVLAETDLPRGAFSVVVCDTETSAPLVEDPRIAFLSFTGGPVGWALRARAGRKRVVLELGGNDPFLVIDDENLEWVLDQYNLIRMYNTGQACNAPKRLIVLEDFYDRTVEYLEKKIGDMKVGTYDDENADIGPLSSIGARDEIVERLEKAAANGDAKIRVGGKKIDREGAYMEPALLTDVDPSADVGCNEIFGPVAIVYKAKDVEEAIEIANNSEYGLSSSVWGTDLDAAFEVANQLNDGMTFVNEASVTAAGLPFGGVNRSGYGRELARWGVGEFVNEHLYRVSGQDNPGNSPAM